MNDLEKHARFGGSSAERWLRCPGSTKLIESLPKHMLFDGNEYTEEGTVAHKVGELCLQEDLETPEFYLGKWFSPDGENYSSEPQSGWYEVTEEMHDCVQIYLDVVRTWAEKLGGDVHIELVSRIATGVGGTADAVVVDLVGDNLVVVDYKHGRGHVVEANENEQLLLYATGVALELGLSPSNVHLVVVQPRAFHSDGKVRTWTTDVDRLQEYRGRVLEAVDRADRPGAPLVAGETQCRYCDAAGICPALQRLTLESTQTAFADLIQNETPRELPSDHLSEALKLAPMVETWLKAVRSVSLKALEADRKAIPGWKLVQGRRGNRRWKNPDEVLEYLSRKKGVKKDDYLTPQKLKSPAQVEKVVDPDWVNEQVVRPDGKPSVAPADDPREELAEPFADLIENQDEGW